jgi:Lrp/AsnC family leucine-responsive transcriptional regulator
MLDDVDCKILDAVQKNGRVRRSDLAELVGLSLPAASDRLRKLEERGYILGYTAVLDHEKFDMDVTAFVHVFVDTSRHYDDFLRHVDSNPEILECHAITGEGTHLLKIRTTNTSSLENVLSQIQSWKEVQRTRTSIVLSTRKETLNISITDSPNTSK